MRAWDAREIRGPAHATLALAAALAATLLLAAPAHAATRTWNQSIGPCVANPPWSTAVCWQGGIVPGTNDDAVISPVAGSNPGNYDLGPSVVLHSITFNTSVAYTITGGPIALQSGGFITDNSSNSAADSLPSITLNGPATFTLGTGTNTLSFNGAVTGIGPLTVVNNAGLDALRLNAVNTYSGATTVDGTARVVANVNGAIPTASALTVTATGSVDFQAESTIGSLAGAGLVNVNAPSLTAGGDNTDTTFSGVLQGGPGAAFTKAGTGTLTLSGANSYSGATTINAGTLSVTGSIASFVSVGSGGTLAGTGSVGVFGTIVDPGGTVAPGTSVGALATGSILLGTDTDYDVELDGGGADRLDVTGEVTLGGDLEVSLLGGYTHTPGTVRTIIANNDTEEVHGTFAGLPEGATFTVGGNLFRISYVGGSGNDVTLRAIAVPTLSTNASAGVTLGGSVHDTATLAGGSSPGGTITFRLYGPDDANCSGTPVFTDTKSTSGNGSYDSASFTPTLVGTYRWVASYGGDQNNAAAAGACNDANETVTVSAAPTPDPDPDPIIPTPEIEVTGLERDRDAGTATLTVAANLAGNLSIEKTNKVKGFGPVGLADAGSGELEVVARRKAAEKLRRTGRITVNPLIRLDSPFGEIGIRHQFELRRD